MPSKNLQYLLLKYWTAIQRSTSHAHSLKEDSPNNLQSLSAMTAKDNLGNLFTSGMTELTENILDSVKFKSLKNEVTMQKCNNKITVSSVFRDS